MNINKEIPKDYEKWTLGQRGKNEPKTNPIRSQTNPIKANSKPKRTQYEPNQTQFHLRPEAKSRLINRPSEGIRLAKPPFTSNIGENQGFNRGSVSLMKGAHYA